MTTTDTRDATAPVRYVIKRRFPWGSSPAEIRVPEVRPKVGYDALTTRTTFAHYVRVAWPRPVYWQGRWWADVEYRRG
jgi:hypothetical protein